LRLQGGASFIAWYGISFTRLTNANAFEAIAEDDLISQAWSKSESVD
tara:strand:- start:279 stop:419 length:141 start_codon:yes stop_codon:yes gene_type:complete